MPSKPQCSHWGLVEVDELFTAPALEAVSPTMSAVEEGLVSSNTASATSWSSISLQQTAVKGVNHSQYVRVEHTASHLLGPHPSLCGRRYDRRQLRNSRQPSSWCLPPPQST